MSYLVRSTLISILIGATAVIIVACNKDSGGPEPERTMQDVDEIRRAIVSVQVRDPKYKTGSDRIHEIVDALRGDDITTYLEVKVGMSEPLSFGQDTDGLHIFATNYVMTYLEP